MSNSLASFRRRLAEAQQATQLPASSRFDLAASTIDDDALEYSVSLFGGPEYGKEGFGMSTVLNELLSREPQSVPVTDLRTLQEGLVNTGYAAGVEPDGAWSPYWNGAFRRSDRDARDLVSSGKHYLSAPTKKFFEYMYYSVPKGVLEAMFGMAKGIWEDAKTTFTNPKEVLEEGGALGGMVALGGTGAIVGSVVPGLGTAAGMLIGGGLGLAGGFFADLFDDEEEEEGTWQRIVSSLSPVEEIRSGDAKNFFAALSTLSVASMILKAPVAAASGVKGAMAASSPTVAGKTVAQAGFRQAFARAAPGTVAPGIVNRLTQGALRKPIIGSAGIGGTLNSADEILRGDLEEVPGQFLQGAALGVAARGIAGKVAPKATTKSVDTLLKGLERAPLRRALDVPAAQVARAAYTPFSKATIGGRIVQDVMPGKTGVEKGMDETEINIPGPVDVALSAVLYPNQLLPFRPRDVGRALSTFRSRNVLAPFAEASRRVVDPATNQVRHLSFQQGFDRAKELLGKSTDGSYDPARVPVRALFSYLQKGVDDRASLVMKGKTFDTESSLVPWARDEAFRKERSRVWGSILDEADVADDVAPDVLLSKSPTAKAVVEEAMSNPTGMQNYLLSFEGRGSTLEHFAEHQRATEVLQGSSRIVREVEGKQVTFVPALKTTPDSVGYQTKQDFARAADEYESAATDFKAAREAFLNAPGDNVPLADAAAGAGERLDRVLLDLRRRSMIDDTRLRSLGSEAPDPTVSTSFSRQLREIAKTRPAEAPELSEVLRREGLDRYIALSTGDNMLFYDDVPRLLEVNGIAEMTRKEGFNDLIGSLSTKVDDVDLGRRRYQSIIAEVDLIAGDLDLGINGKQATDRIYDELVARYDPRPAAARGENLAVSLGTIVKRTDTRTQKMSRELFKVDPRDLKPEDIVDALNLDNLPNIDDPWAAANKIKRAIHVGSAFGADVMRAPLHPVEQARALGRAMKVSGLPGFNDFMRTAHSKSVQKLFPKNSYGYLPQNLHRTSMALRYSLSPTFDAGRYMEQATLGVLKGEIPPAAAFAPRRFLEKRTWKSPYLYEKERVTGEDAIKHAMRFYDEEILGRRTMQTFDELQMRLVNKGILGFSPRQAEAAQAFYLWNKAARRGAVGPDGIEKIRETVLEIGRYGTGQSAIAKAVHFTFFPYLFQAKQLASVPDFVLGAPLRNLLVHEGVRRWYGIDSDSALSEDFNRVMEKYVPFAEELGRLNNLSYGLGPGRFFLEGIMDKEEGGKVAQALASFFVPGGAHQPLHETAGGMTDALKHLFVPVVLMDTDGTRLTHSEEIFKWAERLAPAYRDIQRWLDEHESPLRAQFTALAEGAGPFSQYTDYLDEKRTMSASLEKLATDLGYASWDSLRSSEAGAGIAEAAEVMERELGQRYPTGRELANNFSNREDTKAQVLYEIASKENRTEAEEAVIFLGTMEEQAKTLATQVGITQDEMMRRVAPAMRAFALSNLEDKQFLNLYRALWENDLGPLRKVA